MHILLANRWYPPHSGFGGVAMYNYYLSQALVHLGHQVTIVSARRQESDPKLSHNGRITVHRILQKHRPRLHRLPLLGRHVRFIQQISYSVNLSKILALLDRIDPFDLVEFADVNAEGWAYLHQSNRKPVVVRCHTPTFVLREYHTQDEMPYSTNWTARAEKSAILRADRLTAPSLDMARTISTHIGIPVSNISVIPNILDVNAFKSPSIESVTSDGLTVLHVGRLERVKGIEVLARAIPRIKEQVAAIRFVLVGAGDAWQKQLQSQLQAAGIADQVIFTGATDQETLLNWYRKADIAVVPTLNYESFSYTCAQAMAAGLPLVASRIGGIPETVGNGEAALLVRPGDVDELARAITLLATDALMRQRLATKAQRRAQEYFASDVVARQTLQAYRSLLSQ